MKRNYDGYVRSFLTFQDLHEDLKRIVAEGHVSGQRANQMLRNYLCIYEEELPSIEEGDRIYEKYEFKA